MNRQLTSEVATALEILKQANIPYCKQLDCISKIGSLETQKTESHKTSKTTIIMEWILCYVAVASVLIMPLKTIGGFIGFISAFFLCPILNKMRIKMIIQKADYDGRIKNQRELLNQYKADTTEILNLHLSELSIIPEPYFRKYKVDELTEIIGMLHEILESERADTKKEALNILENDLHNLRMELAQHEILLSNSAIQRTMEYNAWQTQKVADYIALQNLFSPA